jgi:hypothetical protein
MEMINQNTGIFKSKRPRKTFEPAKIAEGKQAWKKSF